jgi:alpha-amylase
MATKFFSDGAVHAYFNPYETPYDAFMNYMNVLSDFEIRLNRCIPNINELHEISKLNSLVREKELIIDQQAYEIERLKKRPARGRASLRSTDPTEPLPVKEKKKTTKTSTVKNGAVETRRKATASANPFSAGKKPKK